MALSRAWQGQSTGEFLREGLQGVGAVIRRSTVQVASVRSDHFTGEAVPQKGVQRNERRTAGCIIAPVC